MINALRICRIICRYAFILPGKLFPLINVLSEENPAAQYAAILQAKDRFFRPSSRLTLV